MMMVLNEGSHDDATESNFDDADVVIDDDDADDGALEGGEP